ncbi:glycosyltransferase family 2 protein [Corynebacterium epidermidicanis]|uniref:Glycosyltransferase like family 2 n=1 Tax=Corynebacterium epidermidicanis TaxID=1050174 RepID=A0A0G3GN60_9CORY|nr:galactosyltransferase-related protein [Corynebacterium epidermidicanis]AKK01995.1 Glycosyltransferase like family 2 [Corynebacterium epidermidicanis]
MRTVVVTLANQARIDRVHTQHTFLQRHWPGVQHGMVALTSDTRVPSGIECVAKLDDARPNLAQARNLAGDWAATRGDVVVFMDADCLPGPELLDRYAATLELDAVLSGPVTYLPEGADLHRLDDLTAPHEVRPNPPAGECPVATAKEYDLFWSLSFAMSATLWRRCRDSFGGFDEGFTGYGGEDTDFGWQLRAHDIPMRWCGGAHAYHQWHPVSRPPWEHLVDIVRNANYFQEKWGTWPMKGWLDQFAAADAIRIEAGKWVVNQ